MTDEELDALATRAMVIDHLLEVDFDTQRDVERDPYGAREAIETALYLIRDQTTAITTLRAQLAEARAERDKLANADGLVSEQRLKYDQLRARLSVGKASEHEAIKAIADLCRDNEQLAVASGKNRTRADRAEAALAAQIKVDAEIVIGMKGHGWDENPAIHTYDKGYIAACDAAVNRIRNQPRDRTALERHDAKTREKALREAAQVLTDEIDLARIAMPQVVPILAADRKAILALIEKTKCV